MPRLNHFERHHRRLMLTAVVVLSCWCGSAWALTLAEVQTLPNRLCVNFTVMGPCLCGGKVPGCVRVGYWEPGSIVETVKISGKTNISVSARALSTILT